MNDKSCEYKRITIPRNQFDSKIKELWAEKWGLNKILSWDKDYYYLLLKKNKEDL